jgi:hypothetical protein
MSDIPRTSCQSSRIKSFEYRGDTLIVEFVRGGTYAFKGVPYETAARMGTAESVGRFFGMSIQGQFESERLPEASNEDSDDHTER